MSDNQKLTEQVFVCRYCHISGYMKILATSSYQDVDDSITWGDPESPFYEEWQICECVNCKKRNIVFLVYDTNEGEIFLKPEIIYPQSIIYQASSNIEKIFRAAVKTLPINPGAAVNQFRVILEMIWHEQIPQDTPKPHSIRGDQGMIKQLVDNCVLAGDYAEMADVLANIGNKGSHYEEKSVTYEDAEMARELCVAILGHVYKNRPKGLAIAEKLEKRFPRDKGWHKGEFRRFD